MDPYRIFFPIGTFAAILGTVLWVPYGIGGVSTYPGTTHSDLMIGGFLTAFAVGFLMTAVPQFTGSYRCKTWELGVEAASMGGVLITGFVAQRLLFHLFSSFTFGFVILFGVRRILSKTYDPPRFFLFVGLGLLMGFVSAAVMAFSDLGCLDGTIVALSALIFHQGMILALTLGVGTHLLPAIWGWSNLPIQITRHDEEVPRLWKALAPVAGLAVLLVVSFWIEINGQLFFGRAIRAFITSFLAVGYWHILRIPRARGKLPFWLWISGWSLVVGLWLPVLAPSYWVHGIHFAFIGGFGLMTLMVASRVTLAHGDYGVRLELRSRMLTLAALLILLAAVTRVLAIAAPKAYFHHLAYSAGSWITGVVIWGVVFVPRILFLAKNKIVSV